MKEVSKLNDEEFEEYLKIIDIKDIKSIIGY